VRDGRSQRDARITLAVTIIGVPTSAHRRGDNTVSVSFYRTGATTVTMEAVTQIKKEKNDVTGPRGNYAPSEITTDLVQKEILKVLDAIFSAR
jgi:hypothetical protein